MTGPKKPSWQSSVLRGATAIQTPTIAAGVALIIWRLLIRQVFSTTLGFVILFLIFVGLSVAVYVLWYCFFSNILPNSPRSYQ